MPLGSHGKHALVAVIREESESLRKILGACHLASVETRVLRATEPDAARAGSKPLVILEDGNEKFALKLAQPALMAAEEAAHELRSLGRRPSVPSRSVRVEVEEVGTLTGLVKPFLEDFDPEKELSADTLTWTELQRSVILLEHAWEWFLDNLDTNTSQYALLGAHAYPLNIDWDRSFSCEAQGELSRFAKYKRTLPNARTFLYSDYVEGRVGLDFSLLLHECKHITRLPLRRVKEILRAYARQAFPDDPHRARALVARVLWRQRNIEREFRHFIIELRRERAELTGLPPEEVSGRIRIFGKHAWNATQPVLNAVLRGPVGSGARKLLSFTRGGWRRSLPASHSSAAAST